MGISWIEKGLILLLFVGCLLPAVFVESRVRHYKFNVVLKNYTRQCSTKEIVTVNGKFPGPTLVAREGDTVLVKVVNHVKYNLTIHWHGIRQIRTGWSDGPAYITQCPIQPHQTYTYNFTVTGQRGTLFYHAHILWLRATVHGAIVILPKLGVPYPFPKPHKQKVVVLGEWWKSDVEALINQAMKSGLAPNVSDAHTINGYPGPVKHCNSPDTFNLHVKPGKKYMLRIVNAALNEELFFRIAGHSLTVVEVDATYVKPIKIDTIVMSPGQTSNVILEANNKEMGKYLVVVSPFMDAPVAVDNATGLATVRYMTSKPTTLSTSLTAPPAINATQVSDNYINALKALNSKEYPAKVPQKIDHSLFFTVGLGVNPCPTCVNGTRLVAAINNITFVMPSISILQTHYLNKKGVFTDDFPANPPTLFNFTGNNTAKNVGTINGTSVYRLPYNAVVQLVLQDTSLIAPENHPFHLHGYNFFVVGKGLGNYNPKIDPKKFNLVDPVERNTIGVPTGGWVAIRFQADNPANSKKKKAEREAAATKQRNDEALPSLPPTTTLTLTVADRRRPHQRRAPTQH